RAPHGGVARREHNPPRRRRERRRRPCREAQAPREEAWSTGRAWGTRTCHHGAPAREVHDDDAQAALVALGSEGGPGYRRDAARCRLARLRTCPVAAWPPVG